MRLGRHAFSMIELMVGVCIFALAILPLVWMSSKQTTGAYHVGKHMMAGQLAASYMDNILSRDYDEIQKMVGQKIGGYVLDKDNNVKNFMDLKEIAESLQNDKANDNIKASFKNFKYKIVLNENRSEKAIRVMVEISYLVNEQSKRIDDTKKRASLIIYAVKYGNKNG